jgi:hypothetical protein
MVCKWCNPKNLFACERMQQERWIRKEDRNGLYTRSKTNLSLHLVANLSLFQQPIACDKLDVIGNNGNLVVMNFLMDEVWIFEE